MADLVTDGAQTLETPEDAGKGGAGVVARWMMEIDLASSIEKDWRKQAKETIERFRGEDKNDAYKNRFNILYSNVETIRSAIYTSKPIPDIRRRYRDEDPLGKRVADVLQRAGTLALDEYDFDSVMDRAVMDSLLPGRAVSRVRWEPEFGPEETPRETVLPIGHDDIGNPQYPDGTQFDEDGAYQEGEPFEPKTYERVMCEPVNWDDFRHGPARAWSDVPWVAFKLKLTKAEMTRQFGKDKADKVLLTEEIEGADTKNDSAEDPDTFKKGIVWEIWDKEEREVIFVASTFKEDVLLTEDDPLGLREFFPCPEPLYSGNRTDSLIPVPEFNMYAHQADELDLITHRICRVIGAIKARGVYDSSVGEFDQLFAEDDNAMIPSDNGGMALQSGGMDRAVWFLPIDTLAAVLQKLYEGRDQIKAVIFEITGISDIIRGATRASETATAQNIKAKFGGMRLDRRQRDIARYARDIIRLKVEIIAEKFSAETLSAMSNKPVSEEMIELMRQDSLRTFRIDIETDSTIGATLDQDMSDMQGLLTGITGFMAGMAQLVGSGQVPMEVAKKILLAATRRSRLGREVEDAIQAIGMDERGQEQTPQEKPDPAAQAAQAQAQLQAKESEVRMQIEAQKLQLATQKAEREAGMAEQRATAEMALAERKMEADLDLKLREIEAEIELKREEMRLKYEAELAKNEMNAEAKLVDGLVKSGSGEIDAS
jgi:hypothetical protein